MAGETPVETPMRGSRLDARMRRVVATRRIFPFLALVTIGVAFLAAFLATLVDEEDFPTFGDALWWSVVTVATVGYGDIVPTTTEGRLVGAGLIIFGVTFLSFLAATVISLFVAQDQHEHAVVERHLREESDQQTQELLRRIDERLAVIERKLGS
jgi:voltage-gated potassium channel